jgi:polar amino acid transport system substrate-binding protein
MDKEKFTAEFTADKFSEICRLIAPSGALRVGLYPGSPNSFIPSTSNADHRGVGFELGQALAKRLGIAFEPVIFNMNAEVLTAAKNGQVDLLLANATPQRTTFLAFTHPVLLIEQGYLVSSDSKINDAESLDMPHIRVGVSAGSTSEIILPTLLKQAKITSVQNLKDAAHKMQSGELDAFATNKAILFALSDQLPQSHVLTGAWGLEKISIGIPLARRRALPYVQSFADDIQTRLLIEQATLRAGLRGSTLGQQS